MAKKEAQQEQQEKAAIKPETIKVSSGKAKKENRSQQEGCSDELTINYAIGNNLEEAVELFGADVVYNNFRKGAIVVVQARVRNLMEAHEKDGSFSNTDASIVETMKDYKLEARQRGEKSESDKLSAALLSAKAAGKSPEEIKAILDEFGISM